MTQQKAIATTVTGAKAKSGDDAILRIRSAFQGVPIQVGERLQTLLNRRGDLDTAIARLRALDVAKLELSPFERSLVEDAIAHL